MHQKIRFPGREIVTQTLSRKDGFTSMTTSFDENQSSYRFYDTGNPLSEYSPPVGIG